MGEKLQNQSVDCTVRNKRVNTPYNELLLRNSQQSLMTLNEKKEMKNNAFFSYQSVCCYFVDIFFIIKMSIYCHVLGFNFLIENYDIIDIVICSVLVCDNFFCFISCDFCSIPKKGKIRKRKIEYLFSSLYLILQTRLSVHFV